MEHIKKCTHKSGYILFTNKPDLVQPLARPLTNKCIYFR
nr:MAG TPA: hypothetical protein [Caudoviricetes sp.]DAY28961.1 MAG TPA: hypothetical protein [Caudoviricetes sp.]